MPVRRAPPALPPLGPAASIRGHVSPAPLARRRSLAALAALACGLSGLGLAASGCGRRVGDACKTNVDCSSLGDRFCDVAAPGGYCTIEGCDVRLNDKNEVVDSCEKAAGESVCVRFFTQEAAKLCDTLRLESGCAADERCLCDTADPSATGQCLPTNGAPTAHCAKESSERRWCMLKCETDADCRNQDGKQYRCVSPGTNGAEPVPRGLAKTDGGVVIGVGKYDQKFCLYRP